MTTPLQGREQQIGLESFRGPVKKQSARGLRHLSLRVACNALDRSGKLLRGASGRFYDGLRVDSVNAKRRLQAERLDTAASLI